MSEDQWRGSATVEAAIIMPIFLVLLTTMLMFAMFVYEKAAIRSVCNHVVAEGAAIWQRGENYMNRYYANNGIPEEETQEKVHIYEIYVNYFSELVEMDKTEKINILTDHLKKEILSHTFVLTEDDIKLEVLLDSIIIHKRLKAYVKAEYHLPFYSNTSEVYAECVISGQTELIRTIDFAADMLDEPMADVKEKYNQVIVELKKLLEKIKIE